MSDADGPTNETSSSKTESRIDPSASPSLDVDATLDTTGTPGSGVSVADRAVLEPRFIGNYQLIKKLGEGGMGQVWLAEQTAPVRRQVALKLIKVGMYDDSVLKRFQSERQSLAIMNHPSIAKVFDAGATPDGQPYFVMEYVAGVPITEYCDAKRLKIRERLELFIKVCEGVQHAHQKAIIHRDLKPANVLVVEVDGKPMPRIIDFGLAKAKTPQTAGEVMLTQVGSFVGTPAYMSPEQADPGMHDVDTRTDVYSLGVVLYELLTGSLPFDRKQWQRQPWYEVQRQLREQDPPRPSTRVQAQKESSATASEMRGTVPRQLASLLRGHLDWITTKALEKERARRYGTPGELAADVERYLNHEPVMARPVSAGYRLQKYVGRHRVAVGVAAGLVLLLAGFSVLQAVQLRRITRERDRANRITDFMTGMFKLSDPNQARGNAVTAREILDKASKDIGAGLAKDPELQAQLMDVMGVVYDNLGLYPQAESLMRRAVEIRLQAVGPKHPDTLAAEEHLGYEIFREGRYNDAEKLLRPLIDNSRRMLGPTNPTTLAAMEALGKTLDDEGRYPEAEKLERESLNIQMRILGAESRPAARAAGNLADLLRHEGQFAESEKLHRHAIDTYRRILGPEHSSTLMEMHNLANVLVDEGHPAEAEKLYRETLDIDRRVLGLRHPDTALSMNDLANVLSDEGRYEEAEKLNQEALEIRRRVFGPDHPITASSVYNLACLAALMGRRDEALSLLSQAVDHGLGHDLDLGMNKDTDLKSLHGDPRFDALVARAKERAAATQNPE